MQWAGQVDLGKFVIAAAPFGGPIGNLLLLYYYYIYY